MMFKAILWNSVEKEPLKRFFIFFFYWICRKIRWIGKQPSRAVPSDAVVCRILDGVWHERSPRGFDDRCRAEPRRTAPVHVVHHCRNPQGRHSIVHRQGTHLDQFHVTFWFFFLVSLVLFLHVLLKLVDFFFVSRSIPSLTRWSMGVRWSIPTCLGLPTALKSSVFWRRLPTTSARVYNPWPLLRVSTAR